MAFMRYEEYEQMSDKKSFALALEEGKKIFYPLVGSMNRGRLSYEQLLLIQRWAIAHFNYTPDEMKFEKSDFWDTRAWKEMILTGRLKDDCDGFGYAVLGIIYYIFGYSKDDIYRASCATETKEGHFVAWVQDELDVYYQMENRVQRPRSIRYMKDLGYEYWHYSSMTDAGKWFNAKQKVANILYDTPSNLASDAPEFSFKKAFSIEKSKTLLKDWFTVVTGGIVTTVNVMRDSAPNMVDTLQANQTNMSTFMDGKTVGMLMVVLGIIGVYLRTVTSKDINIKRDYDG